MLTYAPVSEICGVGKTTTVTTLTVGHEEAGLDVLAIDMDTRDGNLTDLLDTAYDRTAADTDKLIRHRVSCLENPVETLSKTADSGVDLIPSQNTLGTLYEILLDGSGEVALNDITEPVPQDDEAYATYRQRGCKEFFAFQDRKPCERIHSRVVATLGLTNSRGPNEIPFA